MKNLVWVFGAFFLFFGIQNVSAQTIVPEVISTNIGSYNVEVYIPAGASGSLPTVVFIPGNGEVGSDRNKLYTNGPLYFIKNAAWRPDFIVIGVQPTGTWPGNGFTNNVLSSLIANPAYPIDEDRFYVTGLSAGAAAIDTYIKTQANPVPIAAVVPMSITIDASCGNYFSQTDYLCGNDLKWGSIPAWGFAGSSDSHFAKMKRFFDLLIAAGYDARWTTYSGGHSGWNNLYNPSYRETINGTSMNIYEWMLEHSLGSTPPPSNTAPTANAGADQSITLPTASVTFSGSGTDTDGSIASYAWTKVSGTGGTITSASSASTTVTGLSAGSYTFRLTVTDDDGATGTDTVVVTVSAASSTAPSANAGADQTITLPTSSVTFSGSGADSDGTIVAYSWVKTSGGSATITSPSSAATTVTGLSEGVYTFWLTVTDSSGLTDADQVVVTVNPAPTGGGGGGGSGTGSNTFLVDFGSTYYQTTTTGWNNVITPATGTTLSLKDSTGAATGVSLAITDGFIDSNTSGTTSSGVFPSTATQDSFFLGTFNGVSDSNGAVRISGLSNATNYTLTLFASRVAGDGVNRTAQYTVGGQSGTLNATDNVSGTVVFQNVTPSNGVIDISVSKTGTWAYLGVLQLAVSNGSSSDTSAPTTPQNLSASGTSQTQTTLSWSTATDNVGVTGYKIYRGGTQIATSTSTTYTATGLSSGATYSFTVAAYDAAGNTSAQSAAVSVTASSVSSNSAPTANAGTDRSVTLPTSSITLSGSGTDSDGSIASYAWTKVSGTGGAITSSSSASTTVTGLSAGSYTFRLTVTDDDGATDTDDMVVTVSVAGAGGGACSSKKIVILGSSTAAGTGASPTSNGWAWRFKTYFEGLATGNSVENLAYSGYTTYNILPTGSTVPAGFTIGTGTNITAAVSKNPCAIIINMPSNDEANNLSIATQQNNWNTIAATAQAANIPLFVTTTQPREWPLTTQGRQNLMTMRDWIVTRFGANSIDFWTTIADPDGNVVATYDSDGVHVNNLGHELLYNRVLAESIPGTSSTSNTSPTSNAGTDKAITLPSNSVTLTGSGTDIGGSIVSYSWTKISTLTATITSPSSATTTITGLVAGTHTFRLTVTDNGGLTATDDVLVVVGTGGACKSVSSVGIIPSGGTDFWFMGNLNTAFNLNPCDTVVLQAGTYGRIDIGIADGITFTNNGQVTINSVNFYPGSKNVKLLGNGTPGIQYGIKLNGANSFATYWKATGELEIAYVEVVGTAAGIEVKHPPGEAYTQNFANVKIHDNYIHDHRLEGMYIGMDNLALDVLINAEIYNNIVRNSGNDGIQTRNGTFNIHDNIVDNVALSPAFPYDINGILVGGNTKDSIIRNNTVSRVPGTAIFNNGWGNHTIACNVISSTQPGIFTKNYEFATEDLQDVGFQNFSIQNNTVTSTSGIALQTYYSSNGSTTTTNFSNNKTTGSVDANYTVTQSNNTGSVVPNCSTTPPPTNSAPTANAGTDRSITLPTSSVTLSGSGTDSDGTIASYAWTKVSGTGGTITSSSSASTTVTGLSAGSYTFRLTVTDDDGATDTDDVVVVVVANTPPTANAGSDATIVLPISTRTLSGSATDIGGSIASYAWTKVSGGSATITTPTQASTVVTGLAQGTYTFRLTVTDNGGLTATDDVVITVNAIQSNTPPSVSVGLDKIIVLPVDTVTLEGIASDSDGTIGSYLWTRFSGTGGTITSPTTATTTITGLARGVHTFRLTVTDNEGLTAGDDVVINVVSPTVISGGGGSAGGGGGGSSGGSGGGTSGGGVSPGNTGGGTTSSSRTVSVNNLNVRIAPVNGAVTKQIARNTLVTVLSTQGAWSQVKLGDGTTGWVYSAYLSGGASATGGSTTMSVKMVNTNILNVRLAPINGAVTTQIVRNTPVVVLVTQGTWVQVQLPNGTIGWVYAPLLSGTTPVTTPGVVTNTKTFSVGSTVTVTARLLNVRNIPKTGSVLGNVAANTVGTVEAAPVNVPGWVYVKWNGGISGYVSVQYLK